MITRLKKSTLKKSALIILAMLIFMIAMIVTSVIVTAVSYHSIRINYLFVDGTPAHDPYIATYGNGASINLEVTNPNINGYVPMVVNEGYQVSDLPDQGTEEKKTTFNIASLDNDETKTVYYVAGLTHYAARYYKQNIYDDLYTLDSDLTEANKNLYGYTGNSPTNLEQVTIEGFTNLFHEPDAIAADGSTVFRVYYDRNYYTVNFDLGEGGYGVEPVYAKYQTVYRIDQPERLGYTFKGWARTDADSTKGTYGEDWHYIDASGNIINEATATNVQNLVPLTGDQVVPAKNTYYKAVWAPGTTSFSVVYWVENADNNDYTTIAVRDFKNVFISGQETPVTPGMTITNNTTVRNYAQKAYDTGVVSTIPSIARNDIKITDLFDLNLNYANPNDPRNADPNPNDPSYDPDAQIYKYDKDGNIIDFNEISKGTSTELSGCEDFFELNTANDNNVDPKYRTDSTMTVRGDGTTRFNVFFKRKTFTLKFYYARQGYTNGVLDPNKFSLTNSTKQFNYKANDAKYLNTSSKNVLEAIAEGSWAHNTAESLPTVKDEYKQRVTEGYNDFVDNGNGYYRYYYYQIQAKYNEPLKDKWLIDALNNVHRKNSDAKEMCIPGSIATEYYNKYYQDRKSSPNFTVKGVYEKLGKGILFTDDARTTMKQQNIDYTELHFLISWTNTDYTNGWNSSIENVLHFRYENYTELLPREVEIVEHSGEQALLNEGVYTEVRQFTTKVDENGSWVSKTKWYGLSTDHVYETIDSGDQYGRSKSLADRNNAVYTNQTATAMTGFELEYYRETNGFLTLDTYNTEIDWSQDTNNYRRCIIKFFYRRRSYTLSYHNGNQIDTSRTVPYQAPLNSAYTQTEDGHEAGEYRYYFNNPEYYVKSLRGYYSFSDWYDDPKFGDDNVIDKDVYTMPADDVVFYAKWEPKKINVVFYDEYNDYYVDKSSGYTKSDKRIVLGKDENNNDITEWTVNYGEYTPLNRIPANSHEEQNTRPVLNPIAEGASFAGWYYIRNRVPERFEPENVPVTALNDESASDDNATLRLFAEWVTKDVAKYKINYVKAYEKDENGDPTEDLVEVAAPTTGRAFVYKTKTFNAKGADDLYDDYKWTAQGSEDGTNWWPTTNSHSISIKANTRGDEYSPNTYNFEYIQKNSVHYKVQYLDAATRYPINPEGADIEKTSTHGSVEEDAMVIPGYIAREASQTMVLTASSASTAAEQEAEELSTNVITFLYDLNTTDYLYEVEYYTQNVNDNDYSLYQKESLTETIVEGGDTTVSVSALCNRAIPTMLTDNGYERKLNAITYTATSSSGTSAPVSVADNGTVTLVDNDKRTIRIYFDRKTYPYTYVYVDHTQEKLYNDTPAAERGDMWNGVIATYTDAGTGRTDQEVTITPDEFTTYTSGGTTTNYVRIGSGNISLTIQPVPPAQPDVNKIKIYYRKDIERELDYKMVCVNDNADTDYDQTTGDPLYGRLSVTMQTVEDYNTIQSVTFFNNNEETDDNGNYIHLHKYNFLGWYTTPTYDPEHPEANRLTTNETLSKEDLGTSGALPVRDTEYYALVEQVMVKMDVMFCCVDNYTVDSLKAEDDDLALQAVIQNARDNNELSLTGERVGEDVVFTNPTAYENHAEVPWHRNDGYSLHMESIDNRVYKYEFAEWWEIDEEKNNQLIRHDNWNNSLGWDPSSLSNQLSRNKNQYLIAVYARRDVTQMPYTIKYRFNTRNNGTQDYVVKGTLTGNALDDITLNNDDVKINNEGCYELTDEFILENAPYESNHGETFCWTNEDGYIDKTSEKGDSNAQTAEAQEDRIITTITAKQEAQKVSVHYRLTDSGEYSTFRTTIGSNRGMDSRLEALNLTGNDNFSYWAISQTESGPVIAKCKDAWFTFRIFSDYWITPVFKNGDNTVKLNPTAIATGEEDWLAWTWNEGEDGTLVHPTADLVFAGLKDKVKFARVPKGTTTLGTNWSNVWNQTTDLDIVNNDNDYNGQVFTLTGWDNSLMVGEWVDEWSGATVNIARIDYSRNRWTDENGNIAANGSTDLLYSDYEIEYRDGQLIKNNTDYTTGIIFELCGQLTSGTTFNPDTCNYGSNFTTLGKAVVAVKGGKTPKAYNFNGTRREIQINQIPTSALTNKNRVEVSKYFPNAWEMVEGSETHINRDAIMKVTAYIIDDNDNVTFSNSVYACLNAVGNKDLAKDSDCDNNPDNNTIVNDPYKDESSNN